MFRITPKPREPRPSFSRQRQDQCVVASVSMPACTDGQDLAMQGGEGRLHLGSQDGLSKQADQRVGEHREAQSGLCRPEAIEGQAIQAEIGLEFLDPIFLSCPS